MPNNTLVHGVTLREFNEILKRGFANMYAKNHLGGVAAPKLTKID